MYIKKFSEISKDDVAEVGGKGASLGEMINAGTPVPPGFVVTAETYRQFINSQIPVDIQEEILWAFDELGVERVAVRSSAVAEDSKTASWAGQLESYLNVTKNGLIDAIRECWNSIKSERALSYAAEQNLNEGDLVVAVVVQKMVESEVSGVMFTVNPVTHDQNEIMIEAGFGLGEMIVQGMITPDNFLLDKNSLEIKNIDVQTQDKKLVFQNGENVEVTLDQIEGSKQALNEDQIMALAKIGREIENHYGFPCDIEWAYEKGKFYIVQSRPITT